MACPSDLNDEQWELIKDHFNTGNYIIDIEQVLSNIHLKFKRNPSTKPR